MRFLTCFVLGRQPLFHSEPAPASLSSQSFLQPDLGLPTMPTEKKTQSNSYAIMSFLTRYHSTPVECSPMVPLRLEGSKNICILYSKTNQRNGNRIHSMGVACNGQIIEEFNIFHGNFLDD